MSTRPKAYSYIRMSTETQLRGDSKRRQEEASRLYAEEHDLDLVEETELHDIGVSAFKGRNVSGGALGTFLKAVSDGRIERGSFLLVESLDRLSRQQVMRSLTIFTEIINSGIKLVTLTDGVVYADDQTDFGQLLYSLVVMSRAHEESAMKSQRVAAAWSQKRATISTKKLTAQGPAWLRLQDDRTEFEIIPERIEIVLRIFKLCDEGMGAHSIARTLSEDGVSTFGRSERWAAASVNKILGNRAVIGEFQPKRAGKAEGDAVENYYPAIVPSELFYRCQAARSERRSTGRGRKGDRVKNLFSGLATCGDCGAKMRYLEKGEYSYLRCSKAMQGGCPTSGWAYFDFEASFLAFVQEIDFSSLDEGGVGPSQSQRLREREKALAAEIVELERKRENAFDMTSDPSFDSEYVRRKITELDGEVERKATERIETQSQLNSAVGGVTSSSSETLRKLAGRLASAEATYAERTHASALIKEQIGAIMLFPDGGKHLLSNAAKALMADLSENGVSPKKAKELIRNQGATGSRYFVTALKRQPTWFRKVLPDPHDPLDLRQTVSRGDIDALAAFWRGEEAVDADMDEVWPSGAES